jgi:hypothetical protein
MKRLARNGVHWQTLATSTFEIVTNEPMRYILPEYGLPRNGKIDKYLENYQHLGLA